MSNYALYPEWTRHTKGLYERYVYDFVFPIDGLPQPVQIKQENVIAPEDLGNTVWDGVCDHPMTPSLTILLHQNPIDFYLT